ncbi:sulfatase-like hydrolase/transferase [Paraglaciecola chathamensis]|uniref:Sulfatase-like hydrolase/transferase n=1 Tax=Paraglaciecola chathamensis TaxID=368405 RepID=A0ABS0WDV4_9ALTE|nr:sulfatase-like hydrolase/transferase [Paraglaciecola chathamensis]MBJ2136646.1 sulfatase-like hydrolase/transferase [Paraglaciecola chathamensis]
MQVKIVGLFGCVIASLLLTACTRLSGENDTASLETSVEAATPQSEIDKAHQTHTNVVLILIDDLSHYGVTAYGANRLHSYDGEFTKEEFATESIDALAQQGIRIDRAFAYPICENTRIALMSGKRNDRNYLQPKSQHSSDLTFGDAFKKAGYATGLFGKWKQTRGTVEVSGKDYISEFGWDDYAAFDVVTEGQRYINPNLVINGEVHNYNSRNDLDPETGRRWYGPDIINRHALRFIEQNKHNPFFLYYPMILVHDDHKPTPDTQPESIFDEFPENADYNNTRGDDRQYFPDMIRYMDKMIGNVVEKLRQQDLLDNTLIVVMGDNGTKETFGHVLPDGSIYPGRKGGNADNGLHVPLVLHYPGKIPAGNSTEYRTYDGLVNLTDIYPTIAQAAGIELPNAQQIDGISFWPQATGQRNDEHRQYIYTWYIGNETYKDEDKVLRYAFNKHFKRYAPDKDFPEGRFFDLRTDPLERQGIKVVEKKWKLKRFSGLDISHLTAQQADAYRYLGAILDKHKLIPVTQLSIDAAQTHLSPGDSVTLHVNALPKHAQRQGVIWESSAPDIVSVDKFGQIKAHKVGQATVRAYSWEDAQPLAANKAPTYQRTGLSTSVMVEVTR